MNLEDMMLSEISQSQQDKHCTLPLKSDTDSRMVGAGAGGGENAKLVLNGENLCLGR